MSAPRSAGVAASPWTAKERLVLGAMLVLGAAGLVAGYAGTSGTLRVSRQLLWVNVAGAALLVSGTSIVLFLTAGRRTIGRRRLSLFGDVAQAKPVAVDVSSALNADDLVTAPPMTKYHRADCSFAIGKPNLMAASAAAHEQAGRRPCGVCLPGSGT